ncbi:MAG: protein-disulfide reductase DsbD [Arenicellaceae bacterium]|nr:protein-disulfide reductase DsbD [Arenicellaceae bacterium]
MNTRVKPLVFGLVLAMFASIGQAQLSSQTQNLLPEEEAFMVIADVTDTGALTVYWQIADGYYMYRDKFSTQIAVGSSAVLGPMEIPSGEVVDDELFGSIEVYFTGVNYTHSMNSVSGSSELEFVVKGQGCNKPVGVCYPPMTRSVTVALPEVVNQAENNASTVLGAVGATTGSTDQPERKSLVSYLLTAFWVGVLLTFTPCVLPMIPILSGLVAGESKTGKGGILSIFYVLGTAVTYTAMGVLAGWTGAQLQAYFQSPFWIGAIALLLAILSLSLFGVFQIQMPSSIQGRIQQSTSTMASGKYGVAFVVGLFSALIVGACVSPLLIVALGAAIQFGDPVLGGAIMFSLALGMGVLLVAFGFGANWLLPKAGAWMERVTQLFGFMILAVAIYLLDTIKDFESIWLWAFWLIGLAAFCWVVLTSKDESQGASKILPMIFAVIFLFWGLLTLVGAAAGSNDLFRPLQVFTQGSGSTVSSIQKQSEKFTEVDSVSSLQTQLLAAKGKPIIIDFYADWCVECVRMLETTFVDPSVISALEGVQLIKVDVTDPSSLANEIKGIYSVFGPPATLFVDAGGTLRDDLNKYGYIPSEEFLGLLAEIK